MDPFLVVIVGIAVVAVIALNRVQWGLTRRVRRGHPNSLFVERADYEDGQSRQRAGYLIVGDCHIAWAPMRSAPSVTVRCDEPALHVSVAPRGFMPNAGATMTLTLPGRSHRFLTFKHRALLSALKQAGFPVENS